jgi:hypothetical protein
MERRINNFVKRMNSRLHHCFFKRLQIQSSFYIKGKIKNGKSNKKIYYFQENNDMDLNLHNKHLHPLEVTDEKSENTTILDTYRYVNGRRFHNVTGVEYFMPTTRRKRYKSIHKF